MAEGNAGVREIHHAAWGIHGQASGLTATPIGHMI